MGIKQFLGGENRESAAGDRSTSGLSQCSAGVNLDLGNGSYWIDVRDTSFCICIYIYTLKMALRPAVSDPEVDCQKNSFLKVSVSLGGLGPSVAHGKHSVRRRCVQATKNKAETCSLLDAIGRHSCGR